MKEYRKEESKKFKKMTEKLARGCVKREKKTKYIIILNINGLFTKIKGERFYKLIKCNIQICAVCKWFTFHIKS